MKKFTSLLLLLLLCFVGGVNSAYADDAEGWKGKYIKSVSEAITSLDNLTDGFYLFRLDAKKTFLYENRAENSGTISSGDEAGDFKEGQLLVSWAGNSSDDVASFKTSFEGVSKNMLSYVVHVKKNDDGTYQLQFRSGKYMPNSLNLGWSDYSGAGDSRRVYTVDESGKIEFTHISGTYFKFKGQGGEYYAEGWGNTHQTGKFCGANDGDAVKYEIFPVTLADPQPISCTFTAQDADGNVLATITQDEQEGEAVSNPFEASYFYTSEFIETDLVASKTNKEFHVKFTEGTVPFQFSTADAPVWYTIHFRKEADNKYLRHVNASDGNISSGQTVSADNGYASFNGALWAFVREGLGVKLLCKQTGTYVTVENANNGQAAMLGANGMAFIVKTNSSDPNASNPSVSSTGFSLKYPGVDNAYLGDHATNNLGMWTTDEADSQNDAGSCYQIALADVSDIVNVGIASFDHNTAVNEAQGNYLTAGSNDAAVHAAKEAAQSATTLAQLDAAYEKLTRYAYPEANAYYLIKNVSTSEYVHTDNVEVGTDGNLANNVDVERSASSTTNLVGQLWQFEADGNGKYYVKNANSGRYFSNETDKHIYLATEANEATAKGSFTFKAFPSVNTEDTNIKLQLRLNDENRINAFQGVYDKYLQNWDADGDTDGGGYWTFEKVTSITVKILETGWTSVCYPFAVTIPSDSEVKAYYAEKPTTDGLQLTEVEGNVIPANQGVFLVNMEGATTVNLEITNDATATLDNNLLSGATAKRTGFAGSDTYLLGLSDNSKSPALLKSTLTWVPANKAYFLASKLANGINVLSLTFGQNTGINEAAANAAKNETYYDLNGRVVLYPQHGIFVTKSGRKVYVK